MTDKSELLDTKGPDSGDIAYLRSVADELGANGTDEGAAHSHNLQAIADKIDRASLQPSVVEADDIAWLEDHLEAALQRGLHAQQRRIERILAALAAQPRDDVRELLREADLAEHFPIGLRSTLGYLKTGECFESPIRCECYCGAEFTGTDEQEVRQLWAEHVQALAAQPRDDVREALKDPSAVHVNMLRGEIAKPSIPDIVHVYGSGPLRDYLARTYGPLDTALAPTTQGTDSGLAGELERLASKATPRPWGMWFEQIEGKADRAISELVEQVHSTDPIGDSLVMLDAHGKCPAITGCGPTSGHNAALIVALVNNLPTILTALRTDRKAVLEQEQRNLLVKCVRGDPVHHDDRMALLRTLHELESTQ